MTFRCTVCERRIVDVLGQLLGQNEVGHVFSAHAPPGFDDIVSHFRIMERLGRGGLGFVLALEGI